MVLKSLNMIKVQIFKGVTLRQQFLNHIKAITTNMKNQMVKLKKKELFFEF